MTFNDNRNFAGAFGVAQHGFKMIRLFDDVEIVKRSTLLGERFTSCPGKGSSIFSVDQDGVGHLLSSCAY
jgi:hypothetical protein